jgi:hypothetical protein
MTVRPAFLNADRVADVDDGYRVAVKAYELVAKHAPFLPDPLMGDLWDLCKAEYRRATEGRQ